MSMMRRRKIARNRQAKRGLNAWEIGGPSVHPVTSHETAEIIPDSQLHAAHDAARIATALDGDPRFQVFTFDRLHWIEPLRCSLVDVAFNPKESMQLWLQNQPDWANKPLKSVRVLTCLRWFHWLREHIVSEPRLRYFHPQNGQWLNPFNGCWEPSVLQTERHITRPVLQAMAKVLVDSPQVKELDDDPHSRLVHRDILNSRIAGDNPMATGELPVYQSSGNQPGQTGPITAGHDRPMATQEIHVMGRQLGPEAPKPPHNAAAIAWHVHFNGLDMAPITWAQLLELVRQGKVTQKTMLRPAGGTTYFEAHSISGLFVSNERTSIQSGKRTYQIIVDGLQSMPLSVQHLQDLIKSGRLSLDSDLICTQNGSTLKVRDCPGIYSVGTKTHPYPVAKPAGNVQRRTVAASPTPVQPGVVTERWLVQIKPTETVLVNQHELRLLATSGRITSNTQVKREDMDRFVRAGQLRGLFATSFRPSQTS